MIRESSGSLPNTTHPRSQRTNRMVSMGRMGFGGVRLPGKKESTTIQGTHVNSEGNKLGCEERNTEGLLITRKGFLG